MESSRLEVHLNRAEIAISALLMPKLLWNVVFLGSLIQVLFCIDPVQKFTEILFWTSTWGKTCLWLCLVRLCDRKCIWNRIHRSDLFGDSWNKALYLCFFLQPLIASKLPKQSNWENSQAANVRNVCISSILPFLFHSMHYGPSHFRQQFRHLIWLMRCICTLGHSTKHSTRIQQRISEMELR